MKLSLETPMSLSNRDVYAINEIAAAGFGHDEPETMLEDTLHHIQSADIVQKAVQGRELVGFALYARCLWR
jgi:hypothetical protein